MPILDDLLAAIRDRSVEIVDLTATLSERTPIIRLPEPLANTPGFSLEELSRYDERGPAWYWNAIHTGEHVGTHFDAPIHWVTGQDGLDVSQVPPRHLIAPAVVIDKSAEAQSDPDFLLGIDHVRDWEIDHGSLPDGGWLLYRTGWGVISTPRRARGRLGVLLPTVAPARPRASRLGSTRSPDPSRCAHRRSGHRGTERRRRCPPRPSDSSAAHPAGTSPSASYV